MTHLSVQQNVGDQIIPASSTAGAAAAELYSNCHKSLSLKEM